MSNQYTPHSICQALRDYTELHGHQPTLNEWEDAKMRPTGNTIYRHFGSWPNAMVEAGLEARAPGYWMNKDDDTYEAMLCVDAGESIASVARKRGITGQSLGRRIQRYRDLMLYV